MGQGIPGGAFYDEHAGMGSRRHITADGIRIEYVEGRRALRLTASGGDGPVEVPLDLLVERLDIDRRHFGPHPRLLLFAGRHDQPGGGAADLAGWFDCEEEALAAFRQLRALRSDADGWAELVTLDGGPRPAMRAWFGRSSVGPRLRVVAGRHHHPAGRGRHLRLLAR